MKTFNVIVTRDTTESVTLEIEAQDEHEAQELALRYVAGPNDIDWEHDDNLPQPAYVTDVSEEQQELLDDAD